MSLQIVVKQNFSAAHYLENYHGKCEKMHGHTFRLEAYFDVKQLDKSGISIDFTAIKSFLKSILPDHQVLNEHLGFSPSAENLAKHLFHEIAKKYPSIAKVIVWESEDAGAIFSKDQ